MNSKISKLSKKIGLSTATISRVVNNSGGVSEEVRRRVLLALKREGFRGNGGVRRPLRFAVLMDSDRPRFDPFFTGVLSGVSQYCVDHGVEIGLVMGGAGEVARRSTLTERLMGSRFDGAILFQPTREADEMAQALAAGFPIVLIANRTEVPGVGYLDTDNTQGAEALTRHLLSLGHRQLAYLCGPLDRNVDHRHRIEGFLAACRAAGLPAGAATTCSHEPTEYAEEAGFEAARKIFEKPTGITAVLANNDAMAYGAIHAIRRSGRRVPEDISVAGFDDLPMSRFGSPTLTTVGQTLFFMGQEAAAGLDQVLRGERVDLPRRVLTADLIVRESTAALSDPGLLASGCRVEGTSKETA